MTMRGQWPGGYALARSPSHKGNPGSLVHAVECSPDTGKPYSLTVCGCRIRDGWGRTARLTNGRRARISCRRCRKLVGLCVECGKTRHDYPRKMCPPDFHRQRPTPKVA